MADRLARALLAGEIRDGDNVVVGLDPTGDHLEVARGPEPGEVPEGGDHDVIDAEIIEE